MQTWPADAGTMKPRSFAQLGGFCDVGRGNDERVFCRAEGVAETLLHETAIAVGRQWLPLLDDIEMVVSAVFNEPCHRTLDLIF